MEALRARFRMRAAAERGRLEAALEPLDRDRVKPIAHSLAGSGGVFGYPEISAAASLLEEAIDAGVGKAELLSLAERLLALLDAV